jgi:fructoselysine 6-kinase
MKIAAVGECTLDRYPELGVERVGGISLNFAVNARREGADQVALVSCTGSDVVAAAVRHKLSAEGIDTRHLHSRAGATATQQIRLVAGGERVFPQGGYHPGVLTDFRLSDADLALLRTVDAIAVPIFRQIEHLADAVRRVPVGNALRVADLLDGADLGPDLAGLGPLLDAFDLLFVSGDEAMVERLLERSRTSRSVIVVTQGAAGSSALVRGTRMSVKATPVPLAECLDTTGCGDAFQAAFTVEYLRTRRIEAALCAGARRAALVIRHLGATSNMSAKTDVTAAIRTESP